MDLSWLNLFLKTGTFKMETPEDGGVGHVAGLQRRILPHLNCPKVKKVSQVLPVPSKPFSSQLLCYQLSDQKAQDLHQVRAHDVRVFTASQAFQGGVSLDQILSACHWKAHNTFTQFYLKDVAWADSELYHLGPVMAAQQIQESK